MSKLKDLSYDIETLFIDGLSPRAIAKELNVPLGIVKGALEGFGVDVRDLEDEIYSPYLG